MDLPLLPQRPTDERVEVDSVEWLFEPDWPGERLLARVSDGRVGLTDIDGDPVADRPPLASVLAPAIRAATALVDGTWTSQPFAGEDAEPGERRAFVAIDLLELDGEPLLDVPLQERRRLLEAVVEQGLHVRVGPAVKQPIAGWLAGWRRLGFTHYLARHQNAPYRPGQRSDDWLRIPLEAAPAPGLLRRAVGRGGSGRTRRIRD